jgi:hypothetical protein
MPSQTYSGTLLTPEKRARAVREERATCERVNQDFPGGWVYEKSAWSVRARDSTANRTLQTTEERARLPTALRRSLVGKQK